MRFGNLKIVDQIIKVKILPKICIRNRIELTRLSFLFFWTELAEGMLQVFDSILFFSRVVTIF